MFQMWTLSQMVCQMILVCLSVSDIYFRKIPAEILLLTNLAAVIYQIMIGQMDLWMIAGGAAVGGVFLYISKVTREGIGYGDSWAILILGIFLGIWKLMEVLAGAFFILSLASVFFLARKKMSRKQSIPFFPFLAIGYLLQVLAGGMKG